MVPCGSRAALPSARGSHLRNLCTCAHVGTQKRARSRPLPNSKIRPCGHVCRLSTDGTHGAVDFPTPHAAEHSACLVIIRCMPNRLLLPLSHIPTMWPPPPSPRQGEEAERGAGQSSVIVTSTVLSLGMCHSCLSTPSLVCTLTNWIPTASQSWSVDNGDAQGHKQAAAVGIKAVDTQSPARSGPALQLSGRSLAPLRRNLSKGGQSHAAERRASRKKVTRDRNYVFLSPTISFCEEKNG